MGRISLTVLTVCVCLCVHSLKAQKKLSDKCDTARKVSYDIFYKRPLGQLQIAPPAPQPFQINPVSTDYFTQRQTIGTLPGSLPNDRISVPNPLGEIHERNNRAIMEDMARVNAEVQRIQQEEEFNQKQRDWLNRTQLYRNTYAELMKYNPDNFSLTNVIFLVENAYQDNNLRYEGFIYMIKQNAAQVKKIMKQEKLDTSNNLALNYSIQKLFTQYPSGNNISNKSGPNVFRYDFEDFRGEKDYKKMFVSKMLATGKGQCHSMPLTYLLIAERLGAKAWLSLAPQHSFIQFLNKNHIINFEATNGNIVSNNWLLQSGFINSTALKSKAYLDTLSQRQLFAHCLSDLMLGYLNKFGYDEFAEQIRQRVLQINPQNMAALIVEAKVKTEIAVQQINAVGRPPEKDLHNYPDAYNAYQEMLAVYEKIEGLGYQEMPKEAYQKWLKTIDKEKKKQENRELAEQIQKEIQKLKNVKSTFNNNPKQ